MFITWPDPFYHSSEDTPDKLDPTQFKRAAVVGLGALEVLTQADEAMAMKVVAEAVARGAERVGQAERKGLGYIADATDQATLNEALKEARNAVRHQVEIEKAVVRSAAVLFPSPADGQKKLAAFEPLLDQRAAALQAEVAAVHRLAAARMNVAPAELPVSDAEATSARTIVEPAASAGGAGRSGQSGSGGAAGDAARRVPGHMTAELRAILPRKLTVQQIRDFLAGEFEPVPAADVLAYFQAQEKAGAVKLVEKAAEPVKAQRKPKK